MAEETAEAPLLPDNNGIEPEFDGFEGMTRHNTLMGTQVDDDSSGVHYVMVFKRAPNSTDLVENPADILSDCFTARVLEAWAQEDPAFFDKVQLGSGLTNVEFLDNVWRRITSTLSGKACGFKLGYKPGILHERTLLFISLTDRETIDALADRVGIKIRTTRGSYNIKGMRCPKEPLSLFQMLGLERSVEKYAPLYLKYHSSRKAEFREEAAQRIRRAEEAIDDLVKHWDKTSIAIRAKVRPLMRLEDVAAAVMVVMISRMQDVELSNDQSQATAYEEIFTLMNECWESTHSECQAEVEILATHEEKLQVRKQRWSPPRFLDKEQYTSTDLFEEFTYLELLRLVKRRLAQFINVDALEKAGIIECFFPPHDQSKVDDLRERWGSLTPASIFQWPGNQHSDMVRDYFGEEIAFFFDWLGYMTRMLIFPAVLSLGNVLSDYTVDHDFQQKLRVGFCVIMCGWVAYLTASYDQTATTRNIIWGMQGYSDRAATRTTYLPRLRGSLRESAIRFFHWGVVFSFVAFTIWTAGEITATRKNILADPDGHIPLMFGLSIDNQLASKIGCTAVTLNIKLTDFVWGILSPLIAELENWRTDQQLKDSQVTKCFLVKCIVYYYPFFYQAFVRDLVEGCEGEECMHELKVNLAVFILTHIVTVVGHVVVQLAHTYYAQYRLKETLRARYNGQMPVLSYTQAQSFRPPYSGDSDDYMTVSITLGFISMFSVVFPFIACLALLSNMLEMRILAFRMCRVLQRPTPRGQEGIGAWLSVMRFITYLSCITSVGLCIFELHPLKEMAVQSKLAAFIVAEHGMLLFCYLVGRAIPQKSVGDEVIMEINEEAAARILGGDAKEVRAKNGGLECLQPGAEDMLPGKAASPLPAEA